ncbi:MAG: hypothetical protein QM489_06290 [Candidatus Izemoplasma sp.]
MVKKLFLVFVLVLTLSLMNVNATDDSGYSGVTISIRGDACSYSSAYAFTGNVDLLININDFNDNLINSYISNDYIESYPDYLNNEYLDNQEWVSYYAYYQGAKVRGLNYCNLDFGSGTDHEDDLKNIKLVYFDDEGNTIYISNELTIVHASWYQTRTGEISFSINDLTVINSYHVRFDDMIIFIAFLFFLIAIVMSAVGLIFGKVLGLFKGKILTVFLYTILYYFGIFYLMAFIREFVIGNNYNGEMYYIFILIILLQSIIHGFVHGKAEKRIPLIGYYSIIGSIFVFFAYFVLYL